jgi:hypothetical protein
MSEMDHKLEDCGIIISRADTRALKGLKMEKLGEDNVATIKD